MTKLGFDKRRTALFFALALALLASIVIETKLPVLAQDTGKIAPDLIAYTVDRLFVLFSGESGGPELRFGLGTANIGNGPMQRPIGFDELAEFKFWKWDDASQDWLLIDARRKPILCLIDDERVFVCIGPASRTFVCDMTDITQQGISVGWMDDYFPGVRGQFVQLPKTGPIEGWYWLSVWENPDRIVKELNYDNNGYDVILYLETDGTISFVENYPGWKTPCP
jgi:hypothetical protein